MLKIFPIARFSRGLNIRAECLYSTDAMTKTKKNWSGVGQRNPAKKLKKSEAGDDVLLADVKRLLASQSLREGSSEPSTKSDPISKDSYTAPQRFSEITVKIDVLSSTGDGLGLSPTSDHIYVVPFSVPGDVVQAKVVHRKEQERYTLADFVRVIKASPSRDDTRISCKYFAKCSGCQLQMLSYEDQLAHKKTILERAYRNFSSLVPEVIPAIGDTIGSPFQYGYRTKLTPHFDGPPGPRRGPKNQFTEVPPIGFMIKGTRKTLDIEQCPIGTPILNVGMKRERLRVVEQLENYRKGVTILLRESTERVPHKKIAGKSPINYRLGEDIGEDAELAVSFEQTGTVGLKETGIPASTESLVQNSASYEGIKTCVTNSNDLTTEFVDDFKFENVAGTFFQNNNSILPRFTAYVRENVLPPSSSHSVKYLIDAYCGSGLFTVTLSSVFSASIGIDIAPSSITAANKNASINNISNATFMAADASALFKKVDFPPNETVMIIDPPRKGCDEPFLKQLLHFGPKRVVYVSCNVHTQARDVGILVEGRAGTRYDIESLRGFDFFPQTGHVEGVAVLNRVEGDNKNEAQETTTTGKGVELDDQAQSEGDNVSVGS